MRNRLRALTGRLVLALSDAIPTPRLAGLVTGLVGRRAARIAPADALRLLFRIDAALYPLAGRYATAHGEGLHPKHRLTGYHDFFVERCRGARRVLEVGCGRGHLAHDIATRAGSDVVGIDIDADAVAEAARRYRQPGLGFLVGDGRGPITGGPFEVVVLSNVLEHVAERPELLRHLRAATGALRFLVRVPLFERDWRVPLKRELGVEWRLDPTHETEYTLESFADELGRGGLSITDREVRWGEIWAEAVTA